MATAQDGRVYAQIVTGKCHWIFTKAQLAEWNGDQILTVDVTGNVPTVGDAWNGTVFVPQLPQTLSERAATKRSQIETAYAAAVSFLKDYPQSEQMSWAAQEAEARTFTANNSAVTPTLSAIAARTVETVPILAGKVIANADAFKAGGGDAIGRRRARMKAIAAAVAANDLTALQAVVW